MRNLPDRPATGSANLPRGPIVLMGASVRAAAESARQAGFSPIAVDFFADSDTLQAADCWYPLGDLRAGKLDSLQRSWAVEKIPLAIVGGLAGGYQWFNAEPLRFFGATPDLFQICDQPEFATQVAALAAIDFPKTIRSGRQRRGWLLKAACSSGGLGVRYTDPGALIPPGTWMQAHVAGRVCGVSYHADGKRSLLLGLCRSSKKRIKPHPFVYAGAVGPLAIDPAMDPALRRLGQAFVDSTGICGPFNIDVVINSAGVTLLEINPRWSASMELVERAWTASLAEPCSLFDEAERWQHRVERAGEALSSAIITPPVYLKRVLFANTDRDFSAESLTAAHACGDWQWKDIPSAELRVKRDEPLATLIARLDQVSLGTAFRVQV